MLRQSTYRITRLGSKLNIAYELKCFNVWHIFQEPFFYTWTQLLSYWWIHRGSTIGYITLHRLMVYVRYFRTTIRNTEAISPKISIVHSSTSLYHNFETLHHTRVVKSLQRWFSNFKSTYVVGLLKSRPTWPHSTDRKEGPMSHFSQMHGKIRLILLLFITQELQMIITF